MCLSGGGGGGSDGSDEKRATYKNEN